MRPSDQLFRYKVAWFARILSEATSQQALKAYERLRKATYEANFPHKEGIDRRVTVSIGVTCYRPQEAPSALLLRAGSFLMEAKKKVAIWLRLVKW